MLQYILIIVLGPIPIFQPAINFIKGLSSLLNFLMRPMRQSFSFSIALLMLFLHWRVSYVIDTSFSTLGSIILIKLCDRHGSLTNKFKCFFGKNSVNFWQLHNRLYHSLPVLKNAPCALCAVLRSVRPARFVIKRHFFWKLTCKLDYLRCTSQ